MKYLKKVYLGNNQFTGRLPDSLALLPKLLEINVSGNGFSGKIPDFRQEGLTVADFSDNEFEGRIPERLSRLGSNSFSGTSYKP